MKKMYKLQMQKGFTLIELMITVAIVGILASIALPAYQDYTIRAQVSEGFQLVWGIQSAIIDNYANTGSFGVDNTTLGFTVVGATGKYITNVVNNNGVITLTYGNQVNNTIVGKTLTLSASVDADGAIKWTCNNGTLPKKYVPTSCN